MTVQVTNYHNNERKTTMTTKTTETVMLQHSPQRGETGMGRKV